MKGITGVGFLPSQPHLLYMMFAGPEGAVLARNAPKSAPRLG
jgi:hypothetical protein